MKRLDALVITATMLWLAAAFVPAGPSFVIAGALLALLIAAFLTATIQRVPR